MGGGGEDPSVAARQQEQERQARVQAAVDTVNGVFADPKRSTMYNDQRDAVFNINKTALDRQFGEAERQNRFGLARAGLLGGSTDVDSNALLQQKSNEGLMQASSAADQSAADLKTADERTRQNLVSMAQSGLDTGTAQQMALHGLDANAQTASANRQATSIGNLFGDLGQAYLLNKAGTGTQAGMANYAQMFPNMPGSLQQSTRTGTQGTIYS